MTDVYTPYIGRSTTIISNIRRTDNKLIYFFQLDGEPEDGKSFVVWSNQKDFNTLSFLFESKFPEPEEFPPRPAYVHDVGIGILRGSVTIGVTDYRGIAVDRANRKKECGSVQRPENAVFNCTILDQEFRTNMEHGDTLKVTYSVTSGGFRQMINLDDPKANFITDNITGNTASKHIMFKFDLIAPKHCSEKNTTVACQSDDTLFEAVAEFTKKPIIMRWKGWYDDMYGAGMWQYYLELHRLVVKPVTGNLTEENPVRPKDTALVMHQNSTVMQHTFQVTEPGVYSLLLEARDQANNSRIARRFVTFDPNSEITSDTTYKLFVSSATEKSNFRWQSNYNIVNKTALISVSWEKHFRNPTQDDGQFLNPIDPFPVQFKDLQDDGILFANKFVAPSLDDNFGSRTLSGIPNKLGIVKFEYGKDSDESKNFPETWFDAGLNETVEISETVDIGDFVKVFVRATDSMGNKRTDSTLVAVDNTPPMTSPNGVTKLVLNDNATHTNYSFPSRVEFEAFDYESGVKDMTVQIVIQMPGKEDKVFQQPIEANIGKVINSEECYATKDPTMCFIKKQTVFLNNCWFMAPTKADLQGSTATINVIVYNQAGLTRTISFNNIDDLTSLRGLDYEGPRNLRIERTTTNSFRVAWDLPEKNSCYGQANVIITLVLFNDNGDPELISHEVSSTSTYFDVASLKPGTKYEVIYKTQLGGGGTTEGLTLNVVTAEEKEPTNYGPVIGGAVVGVIVLIIIVVVVLVVLIRRGVLATPAPVQRITRAVTKKYRQTFYSEGTSSPRPSKGLHGHRNMTYDNNVNEEELYIYGGMELEDTNPMLLARNDIVLESLLKSGHFANIYKARLRNHNETVVAKTLKEKHSENDAFLMRAKINFTAFKLEDHPNVLKFHGAVMNNEEMGPIIVYEYCENGSLREYLELHQHNVTIELQEKLFRFGLDIAKGMEYLAKRGITHKRLAARNILLTALNAVKIAGFGPQSTEDDGDEGPDKKERIPIKWMAPECTKSTKDATEKSDVWSYGVVLWEIFSLGASPYGNTRARDIPAKLKKGERLGKPEQCDDIWYTVMTRTWTYEPKGRPTFSEIRDELSGLFVNSTEYEDYYYYKR